MKVKQEELEKGSKERTRRQVSMRRRGDLGEIQGRSIDLGVLVFRSVGGSIGKGTRREGVGAEGEVMRIRVREGLGRRGRG